MNAHDDKIVSAAPAAAPVRQAYVVGAAAQTGTDFPEEIARDVFAVSRLEALPTLLDVLCETTGMGFTAVARVTEKTWTLCAVKDEINFGLRPGGQLELETTLCIEAKRSQSAIVIDHASQDPRYCHHHTPKLYKIESYVSVPIILSNGRYFGNLCAIDPRPAKVMDPKVIGMFQRFAALIGYQLENELLREASESALRDERAVNELRDRFIAVLGHDLRNPLQAVLVTTTVMQRTSTEPAITEMAGRVLASAKRMSALINDILDFARGQLGGGIGVTKDEGRQVNTAVTDVLNEIQAGHPDCRIVADIRSTSDVRCDIGRLQQLTSNLVANALTHGAAHHPIRVSATTDEKEFMLSVHNDGEPIPADALPHIFEPFWRNVVGPDRQGLGLGLSICAQIVRAHNGTLAVTSTRESGTTFTARIPL